MYSNPELRSVTFFMPALRRSDRSTGPVWMIRFGITSFHLGISQTCVRRQVALKAARAGQSSLRDSQAEPGAQIGPKSSEYYQIELSPVQGAEQSIANAHKQSFKSPERSRTIILFLFPACSQSSRTDRHWSGYARSHITSIEVGTFRRLRQYPERQIRPAGYSTHFAEPSAASAGQ